MTNKIICTHCGQEYKQQKADCPTEQEIYESAMSDGWVDDNGNYYCSDCAFIDDETGELKSNKEGLKL